MLFHSKGHAFHFVREVVLNCFSSVPSIQLMTQARKTSISRRGSTKFPGHENKLVILPQKNLNFHFFPINLNEPASKTELISLMANEKECSMVSYFSGPLTAAIILFPFLVWRRLQEKDHEVIAPGHFCPITYLDSDSDGGSISDIVGSVNFRPLLSLFPCHFLEDNKVCQLTKFQYSALFQSG